MPILVFSSPDDHVVPPETSAHLRDTAGGEVEFVTLERSYHVATQDYDRDLINERSLAFIERVTSCVDGIVAGATIPSPSFNSIDIGPLSLNIYGLAIALGVVAAVWLFGRRLEERAPARRTTPSAIAIWAVLAGVIGARLYHVATDWDRFADNYGDDPEAVGGRSRHPRRAAARHPGRAVHGQGNGDPDLDGRDLRGTGDPARAGDRALGQLLQPGAVRAPDRPAVGARDRRRAPRRRSRDRRAVRGRHDVPPDVPVRVAVEPRHGVRAAVHRPPVASRAAAR